MDLTVKHNQEDQEFIIVIADDQAELAYAQPSPEEISFTHTFVPESARGQGVADKLIREGMKYAEENNLKVIAECQAVQVFLKRHPEFERLL